MSVYRFKVYFEDDEAVVREIEIKSTQNFEDFHKIIQRAINFDDAHPASFYVSNDTWRKGKEIKLRHNKNSLQKANWADIIKIASTIEDPHQKLVYEFDPEGGNWVLLIELLKILPDSPIEYPRISKSTGNAPVQYKITTPVDVVEEDEDGHHEEDADDSYTHNVVEHDHADLREEEEEVEGHVAARAKSHDGHGEEDGEVGEPAGEEESEEYDDGGNFEEDEA